MHKIEPITLVWVLASIQLLGLASAWLARIAQGSRGQTASQWLFLCCLGLVGLSTAAAVTIDSMLWLVCGATLALMVLAAVADFGRSPRAEIV